MSRPDPDALLRQVQAEQAGKRRGKLRIFFGFAPGVGKTYRMLAVARSHHEQTGANVVIGVVETHGRADTALLTEGLPHLPRRDIAYKGHRLAEFDLDAALALRPDVLLVDELAHTNAPGSRHPKRWQDVHELLASGIEVWTTLNVQHVESLGDVVAQITRVEVRETVPDSLLDDADTIELVDLTPEALLQRLEDGKVYVPEQAQRALRHFFDRGNLLALRELALRRTAQRVDADMQAWRQAHGIDVTWAAGERLLVCVGPAPSSAQVLRAAARMAAGLHCPWVAAYVEPPHGPGAGRAERNRLQTHLQLAESLGGTSTRLSGSDMAAALLDYARRYNVTRIVIGKPARRRWRDRLRPSLFDALMAADGVPEVHVVQGEAGPAPGGRPTPIVTPRAPFWQYAAALWLVISTLAVAIGLRQLFALPDPEMLFLLAVMASAVWYSRGPALLASTAGVLCYDFFFVPPLYTFTVADRAYILTFLLMFAVGLALSGLTERLRRQEREALAREARTAGLYALSRDLAAAATPSTIAAQTARHAAALLDAQVLVLHAAEDDQVGVLAAEPATATLDPKAEAVARWCLSHGEPAGVGTGTLTGAPCLAVPLRSGDQTYGVVVVLATGQAGDQDDSPLLLGTEQRQLLEVLCRQAAVVWERAALGDQARAAAVQARTESMRASLLSAVSHDLRTPLASITGAATLLRDGAEVAASTRTELLAGICTEAERLERLVGNLLDMTRLDSGAVEVKREWLPVDEVIGSALTRLEDRLAQRTVHVSVPSDLPMLAVDPVLLQQLLVNLLDNACKYSPPGSPLWWSAERAGGNIRLLLRDAGPGLPLGAGPRLFDKFWRGPAATAAGAGLGLAICKAIAEVHGGQLEARNHPSGGAVFVVTLPAGQPPVSTVPDTAAGATSWT